MVTHLHRAKAQLAALASDHVTVSAPSPQRRYEPRAARPLLPSLALFAFWLRYVSLLQTLATPLLTQPLQIKCSICSFQFNL